MKLFRHLSQRGAMFGMDGRLTMAIFMTLSGVMGLIGFTKLQTAKQTALLKEVLSMDEALQLYQSDMGVFMKDTVNGGSDGTKDVQLLWDSSNVDAGFRKYWSGPYMTIENDDHRIYGAYTITYGRANRTACSHGSDCYAWIELTSVPEDIWDKINSHTDESLGSDLETTAHQEGRVQSDSGISDPRPLYFRSIKRLKN